MVPIVVILVLLIPILSIILDSPVGRALAARLERRSLGGPSDLMSERLSYLEGEVERLGSEVTRLEDESQFLHKLLTERSDSETPLELPDGES